ncbi:MAG: element excision factor XisH family protein [Microcoleus sp.]
MVQDFCCIQQLMAKDAVMAKDLFHGVVKDALLAEGWRITHDPFPVDYGDVQMQIYSRRSNRISTLFGDL